MLAANEAVARRLETARVPFLYRIHEAPDERSIDDQLEWLDNEPGTLALQILNRQYYSIRNAAEFLGQDNLATVAGRAEVLVSLLARDVVPYRERHTELLNDTWVLLDQIVSSMMEHGDDQSCFSVARTAVCLYGSAEPTTQQYAPAATRSSRARTAREW